MDDSQHTEKNKQKLSAEEIDRLTEAEPRMLAALRMFKTSFGIGCAVALLLVYCLFNLPRDVAPFYVAVCTLVLDAFFIAAVLFTTMRCKRALAKLDAWRAEQIETNPFPNAH